jgi:hypothetical protein
MIQAENPMVVYEVYSLDRKKGYELRGFSMERDAGKYINLEILDSHHVIDLTQIPNLLALILSIMFCLLLFQAI